jgi:hypothetical protein
MRIWDACSNALCVWWKSQFITISVPFRETGYKKPMGNDLILSRMIFTNQSTIGELCIDGEHECWTLEPTSRQGNGPVCIPAGRYEILMQWSTRFKIDTPHIQNVPGRTFIEIHPGNFPKDTHGCILPGVTKDTDSVGNSREAYLKLVNKIEQNLSVGKCWLEISGGPKPYETA